MQVRQALSYAIDRQQILDLAFDGYGTLLGSSMYPAFSKYFDDSLTDYYSYDPEKAKELLRNTDIKVIAISEMVGYLNSSYFCLLFKNYTGMTPARYREEAAC